MDLSLLPVMASHSASSDSWAMVNPLMLLNLSQAKSLLVPDVLSWFAGTGDDENVFTGHGFQYAHRHSSI